MRRRPALAPGVLADGKLVFELEVTLLDFVEYEFERHQLGEARRGHELVAVLLVKNAVAFGIEQQRGGGAGLESFVLLDGHVRGGMTGCNGRDQQAGRSGPNNRARQQAWTIPGLQESLQRAARPFDSQFSRELLARNRARARPRGAAATMTHREMWARAQSLKIESIGALASLVEHDFSENRHPLFRIML